MFFEFVEEHVWFEGEEVSLMRKDRQFLIDCLEDVTLPRCQPTVSFPTRRETSATYVNEEDDSPQEDATEPVAPSHDQGYEPNTSRPLTDAQKRSFAIFTLIADTPPKKNSFEPSASAAPKPPFSTMFDTASNAKAVKQKGRW